MFGGQGRVALVARLPIGIWSGSAAQHGQSFEAWFAHVPGLVVVAPATPADNHALLAASIACATTCPARLSISSIAAGGTPRSCSRVRARSSGS